MDHFFDKGVFFVDDLRLIAAIQNVCAVQRILFYHFGILLQQFDGNPTGILNVRVTLVQPLAEQVDLMLQRLTVNHGVLVVLVL